MPVSYSGCWYIPELEASVDGVLQYFMDRRVLLLKLIRPYDNELNSSLSEMPDSVPVIIGKLFTGGHIALQNCTDRQAHYYNNHKEDSFYADYAFCGLNVNQASLQLPTFVGGVFEYANVIQWMGLCKYHWESQTILKWERKDDVEIYAASGLELSFMSIQKTSESIDYDRETGLGHSVQVRFAYEHPKLWKDIVADMDWLRYFIELGKGAPVGIYEAKYLHESHRRLEESDASGIDCYYPSDVLLGIGNDSSPTKRYNYLNLFNFSEAQEVGGIERWFEKREDLEPIVALYSLAYSNRTSLPIAFFLSITQALETFHYRFVCKEAKDYKKRVNELAAQNEEDPEIKDFLCDKGQRKSDKLYLKSRIADLLYAEGIKPIEFSCMSFSDAPQKITDTRNYYTHYDPDKRGRAIPADLIPEVNWGLMVLLEYHLMTRVLGFDSGFACERVRGRLKGVFNVV